MSPASGSPPLYALLYQSTACWGLGDPDLSAILESAQARNARLDVTGLLLYGRITRLPQVPGTFVQWLEGPEASVREVFSRIAMDERHRDVEILAAGELAAVAGGEERLFPDWTMELRRLADVPATVNGFLDFVRADPTLA